MISGLFTAGNTIFCVANWLRTWLVTNECPHASNPPATTSTPAITRPIVATIASKVLLRITAS